MGTIRNIKQNSNSRFVKWVFLLKKVNIRYISSEAFEALIAITDLMINKSYLVIYLQNAQYYALKVNESLKSQVNPRAQLHKYFFANLAKLQKTRQH